MCVTFSCDVCIIEGTHNQVNRLFVDKGRFVNEKASEGMRKSVLNIIVDENSIKDPWLFHCMVSLCSHSFDLHRQLISLQCIPPPHPP